MDLERLLQTAQSKASAGDLGGAAALLDEAEPAVKARGLWAYARGTVALKSGDVDGAVRFFEQAVEREPELPEPLANLGGALLEKAKAGDAAALQRAKGLLEQAVAMKPKTPDAHTNLGMARLLSKDAQGALQAFEQALKLEPRHVPALYDKAAALNALGKKQECLAALEATLAVDPTFAPALQSREKLRKG